MIFAIEPESRRFVARVPGDGGVETYDCTADACGNPGCRCRTTNVVMRPRTPVLPTRDVGLDLDARGIDEQFRKRATPQSIAFGEKLLAMMDAADFVLLDQLHYVAKNRICEKAAPSEIDARFDFDEIEGSSLMQAYNDILPFGDTFRITVGGTDFVVLDQYCVKPGCKCTDALLNLVPLGSHGNAQDTAGAISVDYDTVGWEPVTGERLPCDMADLQRLMENASPGLYKRLRARHKKMRAIYAHCRRREHEAREAVLGAGPVGRNDPCPCGSGKKYKKCCMGKTLWSLPNGVNKVRTSP